MRASRLLSTLMLLQVRGRVPARDLARELGVTMRTVYRDLEHLGEAGVPVVAERGRAGGFSLMDGYRTRLTGVSAPEAETLLLAGVGKAVTDLGVSAEATAARLKLLASLPADAGASADRIATRFHLDPLGWYRRGERLEALPALARAVWSDRRLRIGYESWTRRGVSTVDPLGLVYKGGIWYLVAASKGAPRIYRASKITRMTVLDVRATRPRGFDLAAFWTGAARDFESRMASGRATLRVSATGLAWLRDLLPSMAEVIDAHGLTDAAGWRHAVVPIEASAFGLRQLMALGDQVEVLAPAPLRRLMRREAVLIAKSHGRVRRPATSGSAPVRPRSTRRR